MTARERITRPMSPFRAPAALAGLLLVIAVLPGRAADPPAGTWRATIPIQTQQGTQNLSLLLMFSESEGKWVAVLRWSTPAVQKTGRRATTSGTTLVGRAWTTSSYPTPTKTTCPT